MIPLTRPLMPDVIPLTRPLISDELWWSGLARHEELLGRNSLVPRHVGLTGNRRSLGSPLFPRQLDSLVRGLAVGLSAHDVIARHSMLPLVRVFTHPTKVENATAAVLGNGNVEMALGLTPMQDYSHTLKFCPLCRKSDRAEYGASAWRRTHQAPGVVVCPQHRCALVQTTVSCRSTQFASLATADSIGNSEPIAIPRSHLSAAGAIARSMHTLLTQQVPPADQARLAGFYREKLRLVGLVDEFDRLRLSQFTAAFNDRFGPLLPILGCDTPNATERDNWLARLVRRPRSEQSPLRHVLLMIFLQVDVLVGLTEASHHVPYQGRQRAPNVPIRRSKRITDVKAAAKRAEWLSFLKTANPGPLRAQNDNLYSWLWRYDRAWLASTLS